MAAPGNGATASEGEYGSSPGRTGEMREELRVERMAVTACGSAAGS